MKYLVLIAIAISFSTLAKCSSPASGSNKNDEPEDSVQSVVNATNQKEEIIKIEKSKDSFKDLQNEGAPEYRNIEDQQTHTAVNLNNNAVSPANFEKVYAYDSNKEKILEKTGNDKPSKQTSYKAEKVLPENEENQPSQKYHETLIRKGIVQAQAPSSKEPRSAGEKTDVNQHMKSTPASKSQDVFVTAQGDDESEKNENSNVKTTAEEPAEKIGNDEKLEKINNSQEAERQILSSQGAQQIKPETAANLGTFGIEKSGKSAVKIHDESTQFNDEKQKFYQTTQRELNDEQPHSEEYMFTQEPNMNREQAKRINNLEFRIDSLISETQNNVFSAHSNLFKVYELDEERKKLEEQVKSFIELQDKSLLHQWENVAEYLNQLNFFRKRGRFPEKDLENMGDYLQKSLDALIKQESVDFLNLPEDFKKLNISEKNCFETELTTKILQSTRKEICILETFKEIFTQAEKLADKLYSANNEQLKNFSCFDISRTATRLSNMVDHLKKIEFMVFSYQKNPSLSSTVFKDELLYVMTDFEIEKEGFMYLNSPMSKLKVLRTEASAVSSVIEK